jgi:hypothetical protein
MPCTDVLKTQLTNCNKLLLDWCAISLNMQNIMVPSSPAQSHHAVATAQYSIVLQFNP